MNWRIDIIDANNAVIMQQQITQRNKPKLIYKGSDAAYMPIIASQLTFSMLVDDARDAAFIELFTGSETRYPVILYQVNGPAVVEQWRGFLLPERYSEPYKNGSFFVNFVATDRLGQLKSKYLPDDMYKSYSLAWLLGYVLNQTGIELPILYAPAVVHAIDSQLNLKWITVDLSVYQEKKKNLYVILKELLASLRVSLFQHAGNWYFIGENRWQDAVLTYDRIIVLSSQGENLQYTPDAVSVNANDVAAVFRAYPQVDMLPPYQRVHTEWNAEVSENIFPKDIVTYLFNISDTIYWQTHGNAVMRDISGDAELQALIQLYSAYGYRDYEGVQYNLRIDGVTTSVDDYVHLIERFYINQEDFPDKTLSFSLKMKAYVGSDETAVRDGIDNGDYDDMFRYLVMIGGHNVIGNFTDNPYLNYEKLELQYDDDYIICTMAVKDIPLQWSGYIDVLIYTPQEAQNVPNPVYLFVEKIDFKIVKAKDLAIDKLRAIDYTTELKSEMYFSFSKSTNFSKRFYIAESYNWQGITLTEPDTLQELVIEEYQADYEISMSGEYAMTLTYNRVRFNSASHILWQQNLTEVWIQKNGSGPLIPLFIENNDAPNIPLYITIGTDYPNMWLGLIVSTGTQLEPGDNIWVGHPASSRFVDDKIYLVDKWKRYGYDEQTSWMECISKIPHNVRPEPLTKISGTMYGVGNMIDVMQFDWNGMKRYKPVSLTQDLAGGKTTVTLLELKNSEITDYE